MTTIKPSETLLDGETSIWIWFLKPCMAASNGKASHQDTCPCLTCTSGHPFTASCLGETEIQSISGKAIRYMTTIKPSETLHRWGDVHMDMVSKALHGG